METIFGEWKNTVGNYTNDLSDMYVGYQDVSAQEAETKANASQAKQDFTSFENAERNQTRYIEAAKNLTNITSSPSFLTAADAVAFSNNMTEERVSQDLLDEVGNGKTYNRIFFSSLL